ncbi:hypothetical protein HMPREF0946_00798 [Fusobacterium vincentii 3_1_36A2]|uniref:Uncharacterized protein n=1 Tax=Fusobacterium vincentii 3_1_36A2 TaxID=469604 RepID=C7XNX4_FUSVC|nr:MULTISPECIES: hypothetical protein [Fusobacterium]EEU32725.1 hypothetical protein HMPREF0946_00798 [Fusobacterium vincentii 3_1_36A2]
MANEFIEKEIMKERTGANISPIQVDTQSRYLLNPTNVEGVSVKSPSKIAVHENMFIETIEKIAKESEQLKLNNEKNLLDIAMKNKDLEFEEKWATVQDKYGDRFEEYLKDYNEVIKSKKSLIVNSKYLDSLEKRAFSDSVDVNYKDWGIKEGVKRNQYYIKEQNDIALATLEQRRVIGAKYSLNDDEKAKENYTYMRDTIEHIAKLTGMSEEEKIVMLGKNIGGTEVARLNNRIMEIQNSSMTLDEKKREIDKVISYMDNEKIVNDLVDTTMEYYKGNDEKTARDYLKVQFEGETKNVLKGIKSTINEIQREEKARARAAAAEVRARKRAEKERMQMLQANFNIAYNSGNYTTMENAITAKTSKGVRYDDRILGEINALESGNINNSRIYHITGKSVKEINANNEYIKGYVPETVLDNMRVDVANSIRDGKSESQSIIDVASTYSGDNPEMTQLVVNSLTQDGGYTKSIDVGIQAKKGDVIAKAKLGAIGSIEKTRALTPQLDGAQIEEYASTDEAQIMINKLVEKGADRYTAKKAVAEYNAGLRIQEYSLRTGNQADKDILYTGDISRKDKKNANKKMKSMVNQDTAVEAFADSITPRKRMKSTSLKGDLKL